MKISLPSKTDGNKPEIEFSQLVVVGANGKSIRLFQNHHSDTSHP